MTKRIALSLAVALLLSSTAFAGEAASASDQAFLATLQPPPAEAAPATPAEPALGSELAPIFMALPSCTAACKCHYECRACTSTSVKLCARNCTGAFGCGPCQSGTICSF